MSAVIRAVLAPVPIVFSFPIRRAMSTTRSAPSSGRTPSALIWRTPRPSRPASTGRSSFALLRFRLFSPRPTLFLAAAFCITVVPFALAGGRGCLAMLPMPSVLCLLPGCRLRFLLAAIAPVTLVLSVLLLSSVFAFVLVLLSLLLLLLFLLLLWLRVGILGLVLGLFLLLLFILLVLLVFVLLVFVLILFVFVLFIFILGLFLALHGLHKLLCLRNDLADFSLQD
mmetsp:Transcript_23425/g.51688  ORF Transcript_23425/g.51688 Transcript_23425/m.51688 type:complete len:226 (+) Transcript_23425:1990-2667(+)